MPYEKLLGQGRIKPYQARPREVEQLLQVAIFDQMRRKRHRLVYETVGLVSRQEVEQAMGFARTFVEEVQVLVTGQPRLELGDG